MIYASPLKCRLLGLAMAACLPLGIQAASPEPVNDAALKLDQSIQALKAEVLDVNQRGRNVEENFLYPKLTRVTAYVGVEISGLVLNDVSITVDDGAPNRHAYTADEAFALQRKGLHRLVRLNAAPGPHRVRAEFTAHFADAKPEAPLLNGRIEGVFEKSNVSAELEFIVSQDSHRGPPVIKLRDWRAAP